MGKVKDAENPSVLKNTVKMYEQTLSGFDIDDILVGHSGTVFGSALSDFESGALEVFGYTYLKK